MATPNYSVNYEDERFTQVEADKKEALSEVEKTYGGMISQSDKYYQDQINASKEYAETQKQNQQAQTDFAIEKIEQQKDQAHKDYIKEQSGAYVDWQKASNQYGANAEQMAAAGLAKTGFSESSQVSMYNTYQNRVATARESYNQAVLNYNNAIKDARLQNSVVLAEIAFNALQQQLELSLQGFQYKNTLILEQAKQKREIDSEYYGRYRDVLQQINTENALAEEVRQYNETLAEQKRQHDNSIAVQNAQLDLEREKFNYQKEQAAKSATITKGTTTKKKASGTLKKASEVVKPKTKKADSTVNRGSFTGSTYKEATTYLERYGVDDYNLMTKSEWIARKSSYKRSGIGGYEVSANSTYADYLKTATAHAIANK